MKRDEISLKEAAEYVEVPATRRTDADDDPEAKRKREVGNAGATLDAMLAASRAGKTVKGQR